MSEVPAGTGVVGAARLKSAALPVEHGGWGMLAEPILLGLLVAPSWAGLGVALASLGAFLARHPLKLALADRVRGTRNARTAAAEGFVVAYGIVAAAGLAIAAGGAAGWWAPLAAAAPLALVQLSHDVSHHGRRLLPELLGSVALSAIAAAEMRAGGWALGPSLAAWAMLAAKGVCAVLYVRTRLRRDRGLNPNRVPALASHACALGLGAALTAAGHAPWLAVPAFALLLARAAHGLSGVHRPVRPQALGMQELACGLAFALVLALGYALPARDWPSSTTSRNSVRNELPTTL